jgi:outer membrane autotransporter protein
MTKGLTDKSRVASAVRKTAMMGAAATALLAAAPSFSANAPAAEAMELQAAIREILRTPLTETAWREKLASKRGATTFQAISVGNAEDIIVGPEETALRHAESIEDVELVNTGHLTGGIGIEVSTGANDFANAISDTTAEPYTLPADRELLYDDAGNPILHPEFGYQLGAYTTDVTYNERLTILNADPLDSTISIDNRGSIAFSGVRGIKANNPSGESITIVNSGDITSTQNTLRRTGIYASTEAHGGAVAVSPMEPGVFTRNAYGQLTGVIEPNQITVDRHAWFMAYDAGGIDIHNTGAIDMGAVADYIGIGGVRASAGIYTRGDGGTTILNEGDITVDEYSAGILTLSTGDTSITNSGLIEVGNQSTGIYFYKSEAAVGAYRLGGDVYILNTGDILGGAIKGEDEFTAVGGIRVFSLGSNHEGQARSAHLNELAAEYNAILGEEVFPLYDVPYSRLYDTTVVNQGRIELLDGARGIYVRPEAGHSTVINSGTIILGEGTSNVRFNTPNRAAGIYQSNVQIHEGHGYGSITSINTQSGVIHTGDDGAGMTSDSYRGDTTTINEGVIVVGDGVVEQVTQYNGDTYTKLLHSHGMSSRSREYAVGSTAYAQNSGSITVGDLAIGSRVEGNGYPLLDLARVTAYNVNEGVISTGDNSAGMDTLGTNATSLNVGDIITGDYDISAFQPNYASAEFFAVGRNGVRSSGTLLSEVINYGTITTGDGKVGASAAIHSAFGYGARVRQNDAGVITTGDHSIGASIKGHEFSLLDNEGAISVGNDSVGVDIIVGGAILYADETELTVTEGEMHASNAGIIATGDHSIGVRMHGSRQDVQWYGTVRVPDEFPPYYYHLEGTSGTVNITSASYLTNSGAIRVGANSTAVEITGTAAGEQGRHLFNTGTIDASQSSSSAIRVNADNRLGSSVVNAGTIAGGMTFGRGNDTFTNTALIDNAGRLTHSGNIIMNGSVIDFGAGLNRFENQRGQITIAGGDNRIVGADVFMTQGRIEARDHAIDDSLMIDGNLSGDFVFSADFNGGGSDRLIITGDVAEGSTMNVVLNTTEQLKGESSFTVITVEGENNGEAVIAGITGDFADSLQDAKVNYSEQTGEISVTARFGMGHMGTSAASATTMAQHWWMQSVGSLDRRDMQHIIGMEDSGVSVWAGAFQEEGSVEPANDLQDVSFDQNLSGMQTGIEWKADVGGGTFSLGPMYSYGSASANQNANLADAKGDASAYGWNAGYRFGNGLYVNATWQQMAMEIDFRTPGTLSNATGATEADGDGFNVELGYAHKLKSGLTLAPQLQYGSVTVDLEDFTTNDGVYALGGLTGKHSLLRAGLSLFKTFETKNGSVTPLVDVSYLDALDGESTLSSNGLLFSSDASGSGYRAEFGVAARYKAWDVTARVGVAETASTQSALSSNLSVRYRW